MNKEMEKKLVPKLRFPEFKDFDEWEEKSLDKVSNIIASGDLDASSFSPVETDKHIFKIYSNSVTKEGLYGYSTNSKYKKNSITITARGTLGVAFIRKEDFVGIGRLLVISDLKKNNPYFLKENWNHYAVVPLENGGIPQLTAVKAKAVKLLFPKPEEQQKIAACLSSLDDLINAEIEKLDGLKKHKKGLMQQLFPAEGEQVPKLRFPEFKDTEDWEDVTVGDVYDFKVTNSFSRENLNYQIGEVKNIHYGDIHTKFNSLFDITNEKVPYINPDISIDKIRADSYCVEGDMIFADASEDLNDIGKSIEIINLNGEKLVPGLHTLLARQKEKKLNIGFGGYLFKIPWVRKQIQREAQGAKVLGISVGRISDVKISYPNNSNEQRKIVSCLSLLDEQISTLTQKIIELKLHKKGLMQQLFPNIN